MSKPQPKTPQVTQPPKQESELFADTNISMKSGHLTKDAEVIGDGKFAKFRLAANKQYTDASGEIQTTTNYFNILVSKNLKDAFAVAESLKKGDWAYIKGEDHTRSIDTAEGYKDTGVSTFAYKVTLKKAKADQAQAPEPV